MTSRTPLPPDEIERFTASSAIWRQDGDALAAALRFRDFKAALSFIVAVGLEAEALDHHPEIRNTYNRVALSLTTHDAGNRVTGLDIDLARRIEALAARFSPG